MLTDNPCHPGEILREEVILALGISVTEAAARLGVSRVALSRVVNEKAAISSDLAIRLEQAGVSEAKLWLTLQLNYDLAQARQSGNRMVKALQTDISNVTRI